MEDIDISKYPIGCLCGRFQVHELHKAHRYVIDQVVNNHKKVVLFLGVTRVVSTKKNPLDFETRKKMIQDCYPDITIIALPDFGDDKRWSNELDKRVREIYPVGDILLYGGRDSFIPYYEKYGQFKCKELEQYTFVSGTEVRKSVSSEVRSSVDFRAGMIYQSYNQYPKVHSCVDVAIFDDSGRLLLARRPYEDGWRFIGGFCSPTDNSLEDSIRRKVRDDVGSNIEIGDIKYITSRNIPDWRYVSEEDKIITTFFKAKQVWGRIEPSDDVSELKFWNISDVSVSDMVKEHRELLKILIENENK